MQGIAILKIIKEMKRSTSTNEVAKQMYSWQNVSVYAARVLAWKDA